MQGRAYLDLAREVVNGGDEVHWRGAVVHAYYALVLECRDALRRWGVVIPRTVSMHTFVRQRFDRARDVELNRIATALDWLGQKRNWASYELNPGRGFTNDVAARRAIQEAADAIALLDAIDGDTGRRNAAIAALPP